MAQNEALNEERMDAEVTGGVTEQPVEKTSKKKSKSQERREAVQQQPVEEAVKPEPEKKQENNKRRIISIDSTFMYKKPDLMAASIVGTMMMNTAYEIKGETSNPFGSFYKLENGYFVPKNGRYNYC